MLKRFLCLKVFDAFYVYSAVNNKQRWIPQFLRSFGSHVLLFFTCSSCHYPFNEAKIPDENSQSFFLRACSGTGAGEHTGRREQTPCRGFISEVWTLIDWQLWTSGTFRRSVLSYFISPTDPCLECFDGSRVCYCAYWRRNATLGKASTR